MPREKERVVRKALEGLSLVEEGRLWDAERAFKSAGVASGLALVAYHEGRYERAANKALQASRYFQEDDASFEDGNVAAWVLKRSRERLPTSASSPSVRERELRLVGQIDLFLSSFGRTDWNLARERLRERAREWPAALGPLCEERTGKALRGQRTVAAFHLVVERKELHEAAELLREADRAIGSRRLLPSLAICPGCLTSQLAPDRKDPKDPWWFRRKVEQEADELRVDPEGSREELFLQGVAAFHLAQRTELKAPRTERLLSLAEEAFERCLELAPLRRSGPAVAEADLKGARGFFLGEIAMARGREAEARAHWDGASRVGFSFWSTGAARMLDTLKEHGKALEEQTRVGGIVAEAERARLRGDEEGELAALERLEPSDVLTAERRARRVFLRVVAGQASEPSVVREALQSAPGEGRVRARALELARGGVPPSEALRLLRALGPAEALESNVLLLHARLAEDEERTGEAARLFAVLAERDCAYVTRAASLLWRTGDETRARDLLTRGCLPACPAVEHRREACRLVPTLADLDLEKEVVRAYLAVAPEDPEAREASHRVQSEEHRRQAERWSVLRSQARRSAEAGEWVQAEAAVRALGPETMDREMSSLLGRALEAQERWTEAAEVYRPLGLEGEAGLALVRCLLNTGAASEALSAVRKMAGADEDRGAEWLARVQTNEDPDLAALGLLAMRRPEEAAVRAASSEVLHVVAREAREGDHRRAEIAALVCLASRGSLGAEGNARLEELNRTARIEEKEGLPLPGTKRLVLLDTNVLVALLLREAGVETLAGLHASLRVAEEFDRLGDRGNVGVVPAAVRGELLALVTSPREVRNEEELEELVTNAGTLLDRLDLDQWVGAPVRAGEEEVARARDFFAGHARHVEKLTRVKMEDRPDRAEEILRRRSGHPGRTELGEMRVGPEAGDVWLLAQALRLREMVVPGISSVGILSDDRDFRDFREALGTELHVFVL
jgi:tetratricopeptide (TPR) repeat protein/predicted nucleic acid-binding protein